MDEPLADLDLAHEQIVVNDVRLHYVTAGNPDDPLVVCLHGFPEFWYSWRYQLPALVDAGYSVVAPDLRGYNTSEKPHGIENYASDELVGDVVGLIDRLGDGSAHVVGHDWGGAIAWMLGIVEPAVIDRLVVMNAPHPAAFAREFDRTQLKRSWYILYFQLPWLPERLLTANDSWAIGRLFGEQPNNPDARRDSDVQRYRDAFSRPGAARSAINYYRAYFRDNALAMAANAVPILGRFATLPGDDEIPVPTLVCWGEQDEALDVDLSEGLDEWIPDLRVERYPEASHWVQLDVPDQVNDAVVDFLP